MDDSRIPKTKMNYEKLQIRIIRKHKLSVLLDYLVFRYLTNTKLVLNCYKYCDDDVADDYVGALW